MSAAWQGYASARVQARFSRRPAAHDFRQLDSSRSVAHLREALRQGPLAAFVVGLGPAPSSDDFEARLRAAWRDSCAEVAACGAAAAQTPSGPRTQATAPAIDRNMRN